jgi:phage tail-like protein
MDANGQAFWLLGEDRHWRSRAHTRWDPSCRALALASERTLPVPQNPAATHAAANEALERVPRAVDEIDGVAYWDTTTQSIVVRSHLPGEAVRMTGFATAPTDLAVGRDGILYVLIGGEVRMHDLRGRWRDVTVAASGFQAWRCIADSDDGVWVLERSSGRLGRVSGRPMMIDAVPEYSGRTFRPSPENCMPPRLDVLPDPQWPVGERPLALAFHTERGLTLLSWVGQGVAHVRGWDEERQALCPAHELAGARYAYALDFVSAHRVVVRMPGRGDAPAFDLPAADASATALMPCGEILPLAESHIEAPFAHRLGGAPRYPVALTPGEGGVRALHPLSLSNLAREGEASHYVDGSAPLDARLIDSGDHRTVWHRLYAEARIPARAGFLVWCAATPEPVPPARDDLDAWLPHRFGDAPQCEQHAAHAVWEHAASELPHHPGVASWSREAGHAGLFSVLIQDPRRRVRRLVGRYLWVRVQLFGDGRVGPEIAALRAWGGRFSYRDRYLPRLYHEDQHGASAHAPGLHVDDLEAQQRAVLNAGGELDEELRSALEARGLRLGAGTQVRVEQTDSRWLLDDLRNGRTLSLRQDGQSDPIEIYRPQSTPADFLERMLANFEGVLTPIEDRIAHAHLLTDPAVVPEPQLDWLGAWVGVAFDPVLPQARRRAWLAAAPRLSRSHGTRRGLELALDIASGGAVSGGEIIVIEDFRLRRLMATLLGVDLNDDDDPLLPELIVSGNSVVGDTLVLAEAERAELMALFRAEQATAAENDAVDAFYEQLAHRATVLVHREVDPVDLRLLRRIVELESPAHTQVRVVAATWPFLVGIASLIGVDTYLGPPRRRRPARVQRSALGYDYVMAPASLDPRLAGAALPSSSLPPVADAGEDIAVVEGESFVLDGSASSAAPGQRIAQYRWRLLAPE